MTPIYVLGEDGKLHEGVRKMHVDLEACTERVALRRVGEGELRFYDERLCSRCFRRIEAAHPFYTGGE
jgi:hypothetical protein